jgi:hypothetical protein
MVVALAVSNLSHGLVAVRRGLGFGRPRAKAGLCPLGLLKLCLDKPQFGDGDGKLFKKARNLPGLPSRNSVAPARWP